MENHTIDSLLARRQVRRIGSSGNEELAKQWLEVSKYLTQNFAAFDRIRTSVVHPEHHRLNPSDEAASKVGNWLVEKQLLVRRVNGSFAFPSTNALEAREYLSGTWLESYVWCAVMEAGADEACYGQKIEWSVDCVKGINEIDVIARKGDQLILVSCKAISPQPGNGKSMELRNFMLEANYWNLHFANGKARIVVVTTADLIDEDTRGDRERYPPLNKQAEILNVSLLGAENLKWRRLVDEVKNL